MAFSNVGTLSTTPVHKTGAVSLNNLQDVYQFAVPGPTVGSININASIHSAVGNNPTITPTFRIFRDSNGDGKITTSGAGADKLVALVDSNSSLNEGPINFSARKGSGKLFAVVDRPGAPLSNTDPVSTSYQMDLSATELTLPSNLIPVKLQLGDLTKPTGFSGNISSSNTSDVFSFSLQEGKGTQIKLVGISADADIRVIKDNGDRIFQPDELVKSSTNRGNSFESAVVNAPGDYLVQVSQFKGNTNYDLKLNPFNLNGSPSISSNPTPIVFANSAGGTLSGSNLSGVLVGNEGKDKLFSKGGEDTVLGGKDKDMLSGGTGDDLLWGGENADTLVGGQGRDTFVLAKGEGVDVIKDFRVGVDRLGFMGDVASADISFVAHRGGTSVLVGGQAEAWMRTRPNQLSLTDVVQVGMTQLSGMNVPTVLG
ncbi:MAG TPA: pre-peptidase C-terminal domain-containing protein [Trichocoleus sp.]|jgi:Ca2+-binding RTX toxin-like protein